MSRGHVVDARVQRVARPRRRHVAGAARRQPRQRHAAPLRPRARVAHVAHLCQLVLQTYIIESKGDEIKKYLVKV